VLPKRLKTPRLEHNLLTIFNTAIKQMFLHPVLKLVTAIVMLFNAYLFKIVLSAHVFTEAIGLFKNHKVKSGNKLQLLFVRYGNGKGKAFACFKQMYTYVGLLLYGIEECPLNKSTINSLDFVVNRFTWRYLKWTTQIRIVKHCQRGFNFNIPSVFIEGSNTTYYGVSLGRLPTLEHEVTGDVYVIDAKRFLIKNFVYDGRAPSAYIHRGP